MALEDLTSLPRWEDKVYYRTISPRHFEAAAFRICQVLFEGHYSGVLEPMTHYVPLKKDFSNIDEVIGLIRDAEVRGELTENAYRDLIASGDWSYRRFVQGVDSVLAKAGVENRLDPKTAQRVEPNSRSTVPPSLRETAHPMEDTAAARSLKGAALAALHPSRDVTRPSPHRHPCPG